MSAPLAILGPMKTVDVAHADVERARKAAVSAQGAYLSSLVEEWRAMAQEKVRALVVEKQPQVTQAMGTKVSEFRHQLSAVIDDGADQVAELFSKASDPDQLARQVRRTYNSRRVAPSLGGYKGPIELLTQPLHDLLQAHGYSPDLIKSGAAAASYSSFCFTASDFPLPSLGVREAYADAIEPYGHALLDLADAEHAEASSQVAGIWDNS